MFTLGHERALNLQAGILVEKGLWRVHLSDWLLFLFSGGLVAAAGYLLARDGDTIAEGTGLGGMWVGAILVAGATSLPELATNVNAVLQDSVELAIGDLLGSNMFNMLILAVADLVTHRSRLLTRVAVNQALVGTLSILLTTLAAIGLQVDEPRSGFPLGWVAGLIGVGYGGGMRLIHANRAEPPFRTADEVAAAKPSRREVQRAVVRFAVSAMVILVAAPYLVRSTVAVSVQLGISEGIAGILFLAISTSLPEAAVSYTSIRSGSYDLAVGNLLGSNCFNMAAFVPLDIVQGPGSMFTGADPALMVSALGGVVLVAVAMLDLFDRVERRVWVVEPMPALMILIYLAAVLITYLRTAT